MAEKRMFTNKIIESDAFLDMPLSAQALYVHLNMNADDDGFVNNPKMITRLIGAKKGPGSVDFGMDYLSNEIDEIIIDPVTCPNAAREFSTYELERDKNGNFKGGYPDKDNHTIDACRYGLEDDMIQRKAKVRSKRAAGLR